MDRQWDGDGTEMGYVEAKERRWRKWKRAGAGDPLIGYTDWLGSYVKNLDDRIALA
jgi:hypothetical protein